MSNLLERRKKYAEKYGNNGFGLTLNQAIKLWPTPKASPCGPDYARAHRHGSGGDDLVTAVTRLWPTPTVNGNNNRHGISAKAGDGLDYTIEREARTWPTPTVADSKNHGNMATPSVQRRIASGKQMMLSMVAGDEPKSGALNPDWVEWLLGWPPGWTRLEPLTADAFANWQQSVPIGIPITPIMSWPPEPDIPRVATGVHKRVARLKALGNGQVPAAAVLAWGLLNA